MRKLMLLLAVLVAGCDGATGSAERSADTESAHTTLLDARAGFTTKIIKEGPDHGAAPAPDSRLFNLIRYESPVGKLAAYVTPDPKDGKKRPAIVWITGGDNNTIDDIWSNRDRSNDQSASAFRRSGIVMMFPSQRGGNDNPGKREGFYGEVDDVLAATDYLAALPYVDPEQIYLGGHSTGGTLVMLVAASTDRYQAVFSLGPVASADHYGGDYVYCNPRNKKEIELRSPINWLQFVRSPMFVFEGERGGNWHSSIKLMADKNHNPKIKFFKVPGHDHFTVIGPLAERLALKINRREVDVTESQLKRLR